MRRFHLIIGASSRMEIVFLGQGIIIVEQDKRYIMGEADRILL